MFLRSGVFEQRRQLDRDRQRTPIAEKSVLVLDEVAELFAKAPGAKSSRVLVDVPGIKLLLLEGSHRRLDAAGRLLGE